MLDSRGHVKLLDMGLAAELGDSPSNPMSPMGSLIYMAPELLAHGVGGRHTDWWAVGFLAFELLTGRSPWASFDDKKNIKAEICSTLKNPVLPPNKLSFPVHKFIRGLLQHHVDKRLGSKSDLELNEEPFFESIDWVETGAQRASPAFIPGVKCFDLHDGYSVLEAYLSAEAKARGAHTEAHSEAGAWFVGLPTLDSRPEMKQWDRQLQQYSERSASDKRTSQFSICAFLQQDPRGRRHKV